MRLFNKIKFTVGEAEPLFDMSDFFNSSERLKKMQNVKFKDVNWEISFLEHGTGEFVSKYSDDNTGELFFALSDNTWGSTLIVKESRDVTNKKLVYSWAKPTSWYENAFDELQSTTKDSFDPLLEGKVFEIAMVNDPDTRIEVINKIHNWYKERRRFKEFINGYDISWG